MVRPIPNPQGRPAYHDEANGMDPRNRNGMPRAPHQRAPDFTNHHPVVQDYGYGQPRPNDMKQPRDFGPRSNGEFRDPARHHKQQRGDPQRAPPQDDHHGRHEYDRDRRGDDRERRGDPSRDRDDRGRHNGPRDAPNQKPQEPKYNKNYPEEDRYDGNDDSTDRRRNSSQYPYDDSPEQSPPRKKMSLSERIQEYRQRKMTEEENVGAHPQQNRYQDNDRSDGAGTDESVPAYDPSRKKSLQERVAEFRDRRKNSQVRFEDESDSQVFQRVNQHKDFFALIDSECEAAGAAEDDGLYREQRDDRHGHSAPRDRDRDERRSSRRNNRKKSDGRGRKPSERSRGDRDRKRDRDRSQSSDRRRRSERKKSGADRRGHQDRDRSNRTPDRQLKTRAPRDRGRDAPHLVNRNRADRNARDRPGRLSQENLEKLDRRLSARESKRKSLLDPNLDDKDDRSTQSYQPGSGRLRKQSEHSIHSHRSAPGNVREKLRSERRVKNRDRDFGLHE